jgi:hypothetical protein
MVIYNAWMGDNMPPGGSGVNKNYIFSVSNLTSVAGGVITFRYNITGSSGNYNGNNKEFGGSDQNDPTDGIPAGAYPSVFPASSANRPWPDWLSQG